MPVKCEYCDKTTINRSGMSSHMKTSHPDKFMEWRKGSVMTAADKRKFQQQLQKLVTDDTLPPTQETKPGLKPGLKAEKDRKYQKSWYWKKKARLLREKREQQHNHKAPAALKMENMQVALCPRCKCRFAVMVIEEGQLV